MKLWSKERDFMMERSSIDIFNQNYAEIKENIALAAQSVGKDERDIILLAATKTVDVNVINHAIKSGIEHIGENRVQEFLQKQDGYLPVHKHFIGHLQTNKIKDIVGKVELIHSVDSIRLAKAISDFCLKRDMKAEILLQVNVGCEDTKSGFLCEELDEAVYQVALLPAIKVRGLMAIPPVYDSARDGNKYFEKMNKLFIDISAKKIDNSSIDILSMGMSDDYVEAIKQGSNLVRIGTSLFGRRNYNI